MGRFSRMKFYDADEGYYHLISRTIQGAFILEDFQKAFLLSLLRWLSSVYFVEIGTFSLMSNHIHLVVKMINRDKISRNDLQERFDNYYNQYAYLPQHIEKKLLDKDVESFYKRFSDVSKFMQDLKQRFSRWYNQQNKGFGHVWADRYKSVMIEGSDALLACMIYVDLNSVRAGIVQEPEKYKYSGLALYRRGGHSANWLSYNLLKTAVSEAFVGNNLSKNPVRAYYSLVYQEGMNEKFGKANIPEKLAVERIDAAKSTIKSPYLSRIRHFSEGLFLGSREFCEKKFIEFHSCFKTNRFRRGRKIFTANQATGASTPSTLKELHSIRTYKI